MPRTMSAAHELHLRNKAQCAFDIGRELDAERAVSKALADALGVAVQCEGFQNWGGNKSWEIEKCRAALAQYAALEPPVLASSVDLPADAAPVSGANQ